MEIDREYLEAAIQDMTAQRNRSHETAIAAQGALDVLNALLKRLDTPQPTEQESNDGTV
jgi:hypothetical protein